MSLEDIVVLDAGSYTFDAGFAANLPSDTEPSVVTQSFVRDTSTEAAGPSGRTSELPAVQAGRVVNWDAFEAILDDILYSKLGWTIGEEGALLAGESLFTSRTEREQLTQLVFEHNNVAGFFLCDQPLLSMYAVGRLSGCVVDYGHEKTDISTVSEGQLVPSSARRLTFGLHTVLAQLQQLLEARGVGSLGTSALEVLRNTILRVAESAPEAKAILSKGEQAGQEEHLLPDGQRISVRGEGVQLGELLLDSSALGTGSPSVVDCLVNACTAHSEAGIRKVLLENLVICGGGSAVDGLPVRLLKEVQLQMQPSAVPATVATPEYMPSTTLQHSVWVGGAVLSKVIFQQGQHISKQDYDEVGPPIVHRKCF